MLAFTNRAYQKPKAASPMKSGLAETWLPFVNEFRTLCTMPPPEIKVVLSGFTEANFHPKR
jgi:hypothetical protein